MKFREGLNEAQSACQRLGVEVASVWQGIGDPLCIPADPKEAMKGGFLEARLNLLRNGGELPPPSPSVDAKVAELDEEVTKIINASTGESSEPEALKKSERSLARGAVTRDDATRKIGGMGER